MKKKILAALLIAATLTSTLSAEVSAADIQTVTVTREYGAAAAKVWDGKTALKKNTSYIINKNVSIKDNLTIPSGCKLTINEKAKLNIGNGAKLTINGSIIVKGQLALNGGLVINKGKVLQNYGTVNFGKGDITINGKYIAKSTSTTSGEAKFKVGSSAVITLNGTNKSKALEKAYLDAAAINSATIYFKNVETNLSKTKLTANYFINSSMIAFEYSFVKGKVSSIKLRLSEENLVYLDKDFMTYKNISDFVQLLTDTKVKETKFKTVKSGNYKVYTLTLSDDYAKAYSNMTIDQIKFAIQLTNSGKIGQNMEVYKGCMNSTSIKDALDCSQKVDNKAKAVVATDTKDIYVTVEKANKPYSVYLYANEDTDVTYQIYARKTEATGTIYAGMKFRGWGKGLKTKSYDKYENILTIKDNLSEVYKPSRLDECDSVEKYTVANIGKQALSKPEKLKYTYKLTPSTIHLEAGQCYEFVISSSEANDKIGLQFKSSVKGAIGEPTFDKNTLLPQDMQDMLKNSLAGIEKLTENKNGITHMLVEIRVDKQPVVIYGVFSKNRGFIDLLFMTPNKSSNTMCSFDKLNSLAKVLTGGYELDSSTIDGSSGDYITYKMKSTYISKVEKTQSNKFKNIIETLVEANGTVVDIQNILSPENLNS